MSLPNLAGVVTKNLVETIGSGSFKAQYVNWSRTMNLLREHAPGWLPEVLSAEDGSLIHRDPVGGHLRIRFQHVDGKVTPFVPQSIMDHRNNAIPFDKITARDVTDTHRRGICLAASLFFGLAYELWAKMPLESGYGDVAAASGESEVNASKSPQQISVTEEDFMEAALSRGLSTYSVETLLSKIKGNFASGIKTLQGKDDQWVLEFNEANKPKETVHPKTTPKKSTNKPSPEEY